MNGNVIGGEREWPSPGQQDSEKPSGQFVYILMPDRSEQKLYIYRPHIPSFVNGFDYLLTIFIVWSPC